VIRRLAGWGDGRAELHIPEDSSVHNDRWEKLRACADTAALNRDKAEYSLRGRTSLFERFVVRRVLLYCQTPE
jgi:hypothetical protein